ncbi:hypothetical protein MicloDRAFT_00003050 [Microvirga lotononidis]|uniref:Uncharacterized protein n=1 Tax=Microvirga lotononidis TaxID=864069 RepID=I4Z3I6_9HYPH|nr:hypothetical protein MicloDRAFT_00003050 [Microvirga lotononidis]
MGHCDVRPIRQMTDAELLQRTVRMMTPQLSREGRPPTSADIEAQCTVAGPDPERLDRCKSGHIDA